MIASAEPHIVRVIIFGACCGVRIGASELWPLKWEDVDLARQVVRVHGAKKNLSALWREVPIRKDLLPVFEKWRNEDVTNGMAYLIHFHGKPVQSIKTAWKKTLSRAGITRRIRPYDLRHAFATELIAAGTDIGTVAKLMGSQFPNHDFNALSICDGQAKRDAVESLPELPHVPKNNGVMVLSITP